MSSSIRSLIVKKGDEEFKVALDKERVIIGRDAACDLVLDDRSISRQHLAVIFRYGAVYVENLSPTGYLEKNGQQTEYSELQPGDEIIFGPFVLSLSAATQESQSLYTPPSSGNSSADIMAKLESAEFADQGGPKTSVSSVSHINPSSSNPVASDPDLKFSSLDLSDGPAESKDPADNSGKFREDSTNEENTRTGFVNNPVKSEESYRPLLPATQGGKNTPVSANFSSTTGTGLSNVATKIAGTDPRPRLRITKAEEVGREIKLETGASWTVGRSKRAGIVINHPSVSRQHFKIVKIQDKYRIQDLGSSRGIKVNGVNVTDSPLNPFDTILAGKVEMQFLLVDEALAHMSAEELLGDQKGGFDGTGVHLASDGTQANSNNETQAQINLPAIQAPMGGPENAQFSIPSSSGSDDPPDLSDVESTGDAGDADEGSENEKVSLVQKLKNLPPRQRAIAVAGVAIVLITIAALGLMPPESTETRIPSASTTQAENPPLNPNPLPTQPIAGTGASSPSSDPTIDPKFFALSRTDREQIETWYAETEKALRAQDWNKVISRGSDILQKLEKYRSTQDFVLQAQSELNTVPTTDPIDTLNVDEKIAALLQNSRDALTRQDWEAAENYASKVLNLAPDSMEALDLIQAAKSKGTITTANVGTATEIEAPPPPEDPEKIEQFDYLAALTAQYRQASDYLRAGEYSRSIPVLVDLDDKIYEKIQEHRSGRQPAAYTQELISEMQALGDQVKSSYEAATEKLNAEYVTQLQDASAFVLNRQYIQAREVYDSILLKEPFFEEAKKARLRLYDQIVIEARRLYQEALISESIGDLKTATDNLQKTLDLLANVKDVKAAEYYQKSKLKMQRLQR
jgi:pSer/pThr/pTyr-binding forkhead associated (FHA) protein